MDCYVYSDYWRRQIEGKIFDAGHSGIYQAARPVHQVSDDRGRRRKGARYLSEAEVRAVKEREGERILAHVKSEAHVVALALDGQLWSSEELALEIDKLGTYGTSHVVFVIGGSHGLSDEVLRRAKQRLSFGRMTLPHQLMRLVLVEQIYRAVKINRGEPYHK